MHSRICALLVLVGTHTAAAQIVAGSVRDNTGVPVPRVRLLVHPASDSTEAATRIAFTNDQGAFMLAVGDAGTFVVRARRIGFRAVPDQVVTVSTNGTVSVTFTLDHVAEPLAPVHVVAVERRCLAMDDPQQSPDIRNALEHALSTIFARRVFEREFVYSVELQQSYSAGTAARTLKFTHHPGGTTHSFIEEDPANLTTIARAVSRGGVDILPSEASLIYPSFRTAYCFDNVSKQNTDGSWNLAFRELAQRRDVPTISGALTFAADASEITRAQFTFADGGKALASAFVAFDRVALDGERFPVMTARGVTTVPTRDRERVSSKEEWLRYSEYRKQ